MTLSQETRWPFSETIWSRKPKIWYLSFFCCSKTKQMLLVLAHQSLHYRDWLS